MITCKDASACPKEEKASKCKPSMRETRKSSVPCHEHVKVREAKGKPPGGKAPKRKRVQQRDNGRSHPSRNKSQKGEDAWK